MKPVNNITQLPEDTLKTIFGFFALKECFPKSVVCKKFKKVIDNVYTEQNFKSMFERDYKGSAEIGSAKKEYIKTFVCEKQFKAASFGALWIEKQGSANDYIKRSKQDEIVKEIEKTKQKLKLFFEVFGGFLQQTDYLKYHKAVIANLDAILNKSKEMDEVWQLPNNISQMIEILNKKPRLPRIPVSFIKELHEVKAHFRALNEKEPVKYLVKELTASKVLYRHV